MNNNGSDEQELKFLQIWIEPDTQGGEPGYQQKPFAQEQGLTPIITPDGKDGTLKIKQQASLSQLILKPDSEESLTFDNERSGYVHIVRGEIDVNGQQLNAGDGIKFSQISDVSTKTSALKLRWL